MTDKLYLVIKHTITNISNQSFQMSLIKKILIYLLENNINHNKISQQPKINTLLLKKL